jgi:hypothetical protein
MLPGYGTVWFDPNGIANILSLSNVKKKYWVTFDSSTDDTFHVHKPDGSTRHFVALKEGGGLYYIDKNDQAENHYQEKPLEHGMIMVNTVKENKNKYSARDIQSQTCKESTRYDRALINTAIYVNYCQ